MFLLLLSFSHLKCIKTLPVKGLITLYIDLLAFLFFSRFLSLGSRFLFFLHFFSRFESRVKTQEKRKKNARKIKNVSPTRDNVSILHYALGKNARQLRFSHVFSRFSRFTRVFLGFLFTNANQKHSVRGALDYISPERKPICIGASHLLRPPSDDFVLLIPTCWYQTTLQTRETLQTQRKPQHEPAEYNSFWVREGLVCIGHACQICM